MKKSILVLAAALVVSMFGYLMYQTGLFFDEAYNIIPYRNLGAHGVFEYRYGDRYLPFNPWASTGPLMYLPISFLTAISESIQALFVVRALVLCAFILLLAHGCSQFNGRAAVSVVLLTMTVIILSFSELATDTVLTLDGEFYASILAFLACLATIDERPAASSLWLGLSILTKKIMLVTLPVFAFFWIMKSPDRKFAPRNLILITILIVGALAPYQVFKVALPKLSLSADQYTVYDREKRSWEDFSKDHGLRGLKLIEEDRAQHRAWEQSTVKAQLQTKFDALKQFSDSSFPTYILALVLIVSGVALGPPRLRWLTAMTVATVVPVFVWWLLLNEANWHRYYAPVEALIFALCLQIIVTFMTERVDSKRYLGYGMLTTMAAISIKKYDHFRTNFSEKQASKIEQVTTAEYLRANLSEHNLYGWGWFQAPEIQALSGLSFADIESFANAGDLEQLPQKAVGSVYVKSPISGGVDHNVMDAAKGRSKILLSLKHWQVIEIP